MKKVGVAGHCWTQSKTDSLLPVSPHGCYELALEALAKRRSIHWSGRRDSNLRQPAWKAGSHGIAARLVYTGF